MAQTYVLSGTNSDLTGGADFTKKLLPSTETSGTIAVSVASSATETSYAFTEPGIPGTGGTSTGSFSVEVNVTVADAAIKGNVKLNRVNSSGVVQASTANLAGLDTSYSTTGVKTFSIVDPALGTWASGDRLRVDYLFVNSDNKAAKSVTIETGTTNAEVVTPFAAAGISGSASGSITFTGASAGLTKTNGACTGSIAFTGASAGLVKTNGIASGSIAFTGAGAGTVKVQGAGSGSITFTGATAGTVKVQGAASGTFDLTGSAAGTLVTPGITGTAAGDLSLTGAAQGTVAVRGAGSGSFALTGASAGTVAVSGAVSGAIALTGAAAGSVKAQGQASGTLDLSGSATGVVPVQGTAAGWFEISGEAVGTGQTITTGQASGSIHFTGTGRILIAFTGGRLSGGARIAGADRSERTVTGGALDRTAAGALGNRSAGHTHRGRKAVSGRRR